MSTLAIVLLVLGALVLGLFLGGLLAEAIRARRRERAFAKRVAEADQALERARAEDRGWDRVALDEAARAAVARRPGGGSPERIDLTLVEDRPGVEEDRAHLVATVGGSRVRVVLGRSAGAWAAERVEDE